MLNQGKITNAIVSFYYSKYPDEIPSSMLIGDLEGSYVEGGEDGIQYFDSLEENDWQVEITQGFFGDTILFHHTFLPAVVYSGATFMGLMDRDFKQLAAILKTLDNSIYCTDTNCYGRKTCDYYSDITPDYTLTLGRKSNFTLPGESLFEHPGEKGGCMFAMYNSGTQYILGEFFLKNFYSVYDVRHRKIGLGKAIDPHAPVPEDPAMTPLPTSSIPEDEPTGIEENIPSTANEADKALAEKLVAGSVIAILAMCIISTICIYRHQQKHTR